MIDWKNPGRMLNASKRCPEGHICVFNANVCTKDGKIWYGDIDLTADMADLKKLAADKSTPIYVLYEGDGRFHNERNPLLDRAVAIIHPSGAYDGPI
jgi:hypothetical protein